jgi:hypothetical protein
MGIGNVWFKPDGDSWTPTEYRLWWIEGNPRIDPSWIKERFLRQTQTSSKDPLDEIIHFEEL